METTDIIRRMQAEIDALNVALMAKDAEIARLNACIEQRHATLAGEMMASVAKEVAAAGPGADIRSAALEEAARICDFNATWAKGDGDDLKNIHRTVHYHYQDQAELDAKAIRALIGTAAPPAKVQGAAPEPSIKQLVVQLDDDKPWTPVEQRAFGVFLARFPDESSQGIMSLGDAWKAGRAYEAAPAAATPIPAPIEAPTEQMEDPIMVPRGLIGAACYVLRKDESNSALLAKLRALTFARLERAPTAPSVGSIGDEREFHLLAARWSNADTDTIGVAFDNFVSFIDSRARKSAPTKLTDEALREAVAEGLRGLYGCGRVWSAWSVGTMGEDDFYPAEESDECITQVVDAIESALTAQVSPQSGAADTASQS